VGKVYYFCFEISLKFKPFLAVGDDIVRLLIRFFDSEYLEFSFCTSFYPAPVSLAALSTGTFWRSFGLVRPGG